MTCFEFLLGRAVCFLQTDACGIRRPDALLPSYGTTVPKQDGTWGPRMAKKRKATPKELQGRKSLLSEGGGGMQQSSSVSSESHLSSDSNLRCYEIQDCRLEKPVFRIEL